MGEVEDAGVILRGRRGIEYGREENKGWEMTGW